MKDHKIAIMETAAEYFSKGYDVYLEYKVYRFPDHPTLGKKKYRIDILAIKGKKRLLIEVGYLPKRKLQDLRRLYPDIKLLHLTQWKNFIIRKWYNHKKYSKRKHKSIYWTLELEIKLIELWSLGLKNSQIMTHFPKESYRKIITHLYSLRKKGFTTKEALIQKHSFPEGAIGTWLINDGKHLSHFAKYYKPQNHDSRFRCWSPEMNRLFVKLYLAGKSSTEIHKHFPYQTKCSIQQHIRYLHKYHHLPYIVNGKLRSLPKKRFPKPISLRFFYNYGRLPESAPRNRGIVFGWYKYENGVLCCKVT